MQGEISDEHFYAPLIYDHKYEDIFTLSVPLKCINSELVLDFIFLHIALCIHLLLVLKHLTLCCVQIMPDNPVQSEGEMSISIATGTESVI